MGWFIYLLLSPLHLHPTFLIGTHGRLPVHTSAGRCSWMVFCIFMLVIKQSKGTPHINLSDVFIARVANFPTHIALVSLPAV